MPWSCARRFRLPGFQPSRSRNPRRGAACALRSVDHRPTARAGAPHFLVIEARESAVDIGLFDAGGQFSAHAAEKFAEAFGLDALLFEAPNKSSQFALLDHFGPDIRLSNVRLEELLRVEIYRRALHADAFAKPRLSFVADPDEPG
ncbi:MAG: phosphosulfolactate synthase [Solirubrobacterales bacterium]|nr:phosphosulfolactate synthase [Solirubrobacterales bacterium]